ncbi:MAG TPA: RNA polymerase sigma factor [Catenuloplanes sp.]
MADDAAVIAESTRTPERFGVIFDRHAPYIHRYVGRRLGAEVTDDLVAETFLVAFRSRDRYDPTRTDARPWLYGIATNLISQHARKQARWFRLGCSLAPEPDVACHADQVVGDVVAQGTRAELTAALRGLSPGDRDVLLLVAWEDLTYEETASALGIPVGTVRSRLNRARRKVREALTAADSTMTFEETLRDG